jgi:predicted phage terminase large subunit-like protein
MTGRPNLSDAELDALSGAAEIELARRDLGFFGEYVFHLSCLPHIRIWCDALMDESIKHLLIVCPPGHGKPLALDSLILMAGGERRKLRDVAVGEYVISGNGTPCRVTDKQHQGLLPCVRINLFSGRSVTSALTHPFLTTRGWKEAGLLYEGEVLVRLSMESSFVSKFLSDRIESVESAGSQECACITVEHDHTYTASDLVVHNSSWIGTIFPSWYLGHNPGNHILYLSATASHAEKFSNAVRNTIAGSQEYKRVFPQIEPDYNKGWSQEKYYIRRSMVGDPHPSEMASGFDGPILGARANLLLLDDVMTEESANSAEQRSKLKDTIKNTVFTRRTKDARTIAICTRWNSSDFASEFIKDPEWQVIHQPAIGLWGPDTALAPEIMPLDDLVKLRDSPSFGRLRFTNIYQGDPSIAQGNILQRAWWKRVPQSQFPRQDQYRIIVTGWDTSFKKTAESSYSVGLTMGLHEGTIYILSMWRKKVEFPELLKVTRDLYRLDRPRVILIEDKASGQSLIQSIKSGVGLKNDDDDIRVLPIMPVKADSDPVSYVTAFAGYVEAGRVVLPSEGFWVEDFLEETANFPNGQYRDICMAFAHNMKYLTAGDKFAPLRDGAAISSSMMPTAEGNIRDWSELPGFSGTSSIGSFIHTVEEA